MYIYKAEGKTYGFEEVKHYTYLGTQFYRKPETTKEMHNRLMAQNRIAHAVKDVVHNKNTSREFKLRAYRSIIRSIITFEWETWTLLGTMNQKRRKKKVRVRKMFRKIYRDK